VRLLAAAQPGTLPVCIAAAVQGWVKEDRTVCNSSLNMEDAASIFASSIFNVLLQHIAQQKHATNSQQAAAAA
jgi:hypothetical protein